MTAARNLRVDLLPRTVRPVDPQPNALLCRRFDVAGLVRFLFRGPTGAGVVGPLPTGQTRRDQDETLDEIGR